MHPPIIDWLLDNFWAVWFLVIFMGILSKVLGFFGSDSSGTGTHDTEIEGSSANLSENDSKSGVDSSPDDNVINPANGLPMIGGTGGVDIAGNPYGTDSSRDDNAINPANDLPMAGGTGGVDVSGNPYGTDFSHDDSISGIDDPFGGGSDFERW